MRETFLKSVDNSYRYSFGADVTVLLEARRLPNTKYDGYLCTNTHLSGADAIEFIKKHVPYALDAIPDIDPNEEYVIYTFDD